MHLPLHFWFWCSLHSTAKLSCATFQYNGLAQLLHHVCCNSALWDVLCRVEKTKSTTSLRGNVLSVFLSHPAVYNFFVSFELLLLKAFRLYKAAYKAPKEMQLSLLSFQSVNHILTVLFNKSHILGTGMVVYHFNVGSHTMIHTKL